MTKPTEVHKLSSEQLRHLRDDEEGVSIDVVWAANHELRLREDAAPELYRAMPITKQP